MSDLTFDQYQERAIVVKLYDANIDKFIASLNIPEEQDRQRLKRFLCYIYATLGLLGEAGEVAEKLKKILRDGNFEIGEAEKQTLLSELGDVQWYVADSADELGSSAAEVAQMNIDKLKSRRERGVLQGSGDNR